MNKHADFPNVYVADHPLILHKLTLMREQDCPKIYFKQLLKEISFLLAYDVTKHFPVQTKTIETPITEMDGFALAGKKPVIVPILRAGLGMSEALEELMPSARIGHIGLYRDEETQKPVEYLVKLPQAEGRIFIMCDPMLATGHSAKYALDVVKRHGADMNKVVFMALVAAPEGVKVLQDAYPMVPIYTAALDSHLNEKAYIVPGLGDAGDRLLGTKGV